MDNDGKSSRPVKAQYYKTSGANFIRQDSLGATGVIEITPPQRRIAYRRMSNGSIRGFQLEGAGAGGTAAEALYMHPNTIAYAVTTAHIPKVLEPLHNNDE